MAMQAASLEVLERANVPAPQARAIVQAIEIEIAGAQNVLATKQDIYVLELKVEKSAKDLAWDMYKAIVLQVGLLLGIAYFFLTHLKP